MPGFNPQRLSVARRRHGYTKTALASEINVSVRMITAYERGEKQPGPFNLQRLGQTLRCPVAFFDGDDLDEPPIDGTSFRALSTLTAREREQVRGSAAIALAFSDWIDERFNPPAPDVPQYQGVDPTTAAMGVREEWGLGERTAPNMVHLLEAHGVRVFSLVEECSSVDAFSFWRGEVPHVFLNTVKTAEHRRMDAAHELGHLVLHWRGTARGLDAEKEAVEFASVFLMPEGSVLANAPQGGTLDQLIAAKRKWGVSLPALVYRMHEVDLLTDWQYRSLFIEISKTGLRKKERNGIRPETSKLLSKVFASMLEGGVTRNAIADDLAIHPEELDRLAFGLVLTLVPTTGRSVPSHSKQERPQLRVV